MAEKFYVNILEKYQVTPTPDSDIPSISLPLTYFDIPWLSYSPNQTLFFYEKPSSKTTNTTLITLLKQSLSQALHNFYPLAGNLSLPQSPAEPYMSYTKGDSVSLTLVESNHNMDELSGNHPREVTRLCSLCPHLASPSMSRGTNESLVLPLVAIQVTVFRGLGFSIGVTSQHAAADERALYEFMKCWACFCKSLFDGTFFKFTYIPWFDRSVILDPDSLKTMLLKQWWNRRPKRAHEETDRDIVQSTFILTSSHINIIRQLIIAKCKMVNEDPPVNLSLYVIGLCYAWICLLRFQETDHDANGGHVYLGYNACGLTRLKYEAPISYFGCGLVFGRCRATKSELLGEDGLVFASKSFNIEINKLAMDCLQDSERWICEWDELNTRIIGSPKIDFNGIDFGWGKAQKIEKVSSDHVHGKSNVISLNGSRDDLDGGLEIGVVFPKDKMRVFTCIFNNGLKDLE